MKKRSGIDWLRYTVEEHIGRTNAVPAHETFTFQDVLKKSLPWYDSAVTMKSGRLDWHSQKSEQGIMVTLTGKDLQTMRSDGFSDEQLLRHVTKVGGRVSRLDFAIDVINGARTPDEFADLIDTSALACSARSRLRWSSREGGGEEAVTVQFGSRTSGRCLRVYDKAKEQQQEGDIIRYELETKGRAAKALVSAMIKYGVQPTGKKAMRAFISGDEQQWQEITEPGREDVAIEPVGRKDSQWEQWVLKVALPNVIKAARQNVPGVIATINKEIFGEILEVGD